MRYALFLDVTQRSSLLPTFRDNLLVPSSGVFLDCLTPKNGTDRFSRNVGSKLRKDAAPNHRRALNLFNVAAEARPSHSQFKKFVSPNSEVS